VSFNPAMPSIKDNTPIGTVLTAIIVTMSDGSTNFAGTYGFGPPYQNAGGCFGIQAGKVVLACQLTPAADNTILNGTIVAHDPGS
jgi:hypothetical protein